VDDQLPQYLDTDLSTVTTFEDLLICWTARNAISVGVSHVLRVRTGRWSVENQDEAEAEVIAALGKYLRRRYRKTDGPTRITNKKFLTSKNRAGWLCNFAKNVTKSWIRERIRVANGDDRVRQAVAPGCVVPDETFTEQQERLRLQNESLHFDVYQFQFGRGHAPVDGAFGTDDDGLDQREVEHQTPEAGDAENVTRLRQALTALPPDDAEFLIQYVDSRYELGGHSAADRKRFQRLKTRLRDMMSQTV
jgi:DNA-directed RNA polymerase specialized sigma24 family protein